MLLLLGEDATRKSLEVALIPFPTRPAYEAEDAGEVDDVGADVEGVREGQWLHGLVWRLRACQAGQKRVDYPWEFAI